jgi:hypothetical protein
MYIEYETDRNSALTPLFIHVSDLSFPLYFVHVHLYISYHTYTVYSEDLDPSYHMS